MSAFVLKRNLWKNWIKNQLLQGQRVKEWLNGLAERKTEIAKNLINIGMKVEDIIKVTGLSKKEIENLIKKNKKLD